jgi:coenzyme F420-reducing hydrogenase gamma subunit
MSAPLPKLGVFKFASCDGCQLSLLDAEEQLLDVASVVHVAHFPEASREVVEGPYQLTLVEGSITVPRDLDAIREIRSRSEFLVTIGACATAGGIQALRHWGDVDEFTRYVYANPEFVSTLGESTPIRDHVVVDFELRGCPISKFQLLEVVNAFLNRRRPVIPTYSVCVECKRRGTPCLMVARGIPCLGPVTQAGCAAICPSFDRGCYGCFGPMESPNVVALGKQWREMGVTTRGLVNALRGFNGYAEPFREASDVFAAAD